VITQVLWLLILAIPVASISWTITHEEVLREPRDFCKQRSEAAKQFWQRKLFYLFTCEYCFSHYVAAALLLFTHFKLLYDDWRGFVISFFRIGLGCECLHGGLCDMRLDIHHERVQIQSKDLDVQSKAQELKGRVA
jgi:hypothetical protein